MNISIAIWSLLVFIFSMYAIFNPRAVWFVKEGWKYKSAEPEDWYLTMIQLQGLLCAAVASGVFIFSLSFYWAK